MTLSAAALARMEGWSAANAQHSHGEHLYSLDESNLSKVRIHDAFSSYLDAFGAYLR